LKVTPPTLKTPLSDVRNSPRPQAGVRASTRILSSADTADISSTAQQLAGLQSSEHDVDVARVQEIRATIASGTLCIDTSRIADALVESACELLGKSKP